MFSRDGTCSEPARRLSEAQAKSGSVSASGENALERLLEGTQIDLLRPGRARLGMDLPIDFRDRLDVQQPVFAALLDHLRRALAQALAIDAAVDHDMGDVNAGRPVLPRHALRDHPEPCL